MYFLFKTGDVPASYFSLPKGKKVSNNGKQIGQAAQVLCVLPSLLSKRRRPRIGTLQRRYSLEVEHFASENVKFAPKMWQAEPCVFQPSIFSGVTLNFACNWWRFANHYFQVPSPGSAKTKLYPLVGRESYTWIILKTSHFGILYMDYTKDQPLSLVLDFKGMINPWVYLADHPI